MVGERVCHILKGAKVTGEEKQRGGETVGLACREPPQAKAALTPLPEKGGQGVSLKLSLFYCILPPALCQRCSFLGETKGLQLWCPALLGGRFTPRNPGPEAGFTGWSGLGDCRIVAPLIVTPS